MKSAAELKTVVYDYHSRGTILQFLVPGNVCDDAQKLLGKALDLIFKTHSQKRSLNANALYWEIVGQIAKSIGQTNNHVHNHLLRSYGEMEKIDGNLVYIVIPDGNDSQVLEAESYHLKPTSQVKVGKDGKIYRTYILMKGSSTYDTKEMARLIDGAIALAKDMGLSVENENEVRRWKELEVNSIS